MNTKWTRRSYCKSYSYSYYYNSETCTKIDNNIVCIGIPHGQRPAIEGTPDLEATVEHPGMKGIPASSAIIGTCKYGILTPSYSNESCLQPSCEIEPSNDLPKCKILISAE